MAAAAEYDIRQHAVSPLATEQAEDFRLRPVYVVVPDTDTYETAVPEPLVRVQAAAGWRCETTLVIHLQNGFGCFYQVVPGLFVFGRSHLLKV